MIKLLEHELAIVKKILTKHVPKCEVRAFGSRVNGNPREYSDLDLAIMSKEELSLNKLLDIRDSFVESTLPFRVDIIDWNRTSSEFRNTIEQNYQILQPERAD